MSRPFILLAISLALGSAFLTLSLAQAANNVFYVSPTGNDKNAGTLDSPWKTLTKAANTVVAGDTVIVKSGVYNERVKFSAKGNHTGTPDKRIIFRSETPQGASINGGFDTRNAHYLTIEGFDITSAVTGGAGGGVLVGSNGVEVINNHLHDIPNAGIRAYTSKNFRPAGIVIRGNKITGSNFGLIQNGDNWLVENNDISNLQRFSASDADYIRFNGSNLIFRRNHFHGTSQSGLKGITVNGWQSTLGTGQTMTNVEISSNVVKGFMEGVSLTAATAGSFSGVKIFNNVFDGRFEDGINGNYGIFPKKNLSEVKVEHNTFAFLAVAGVRVAGQSSVLVQNNIFYQTTRGYYADKNNTLVGGYNLLNSLHKITYRDPKDLIDPNPPFVVEDSFDLSINSLAVDSGFKSAVVTDILGRDRLSSLAPDIGAYESPHNILKEAPVTTPAPKGGTYLSAQPIFLQADQDVDTFYCLGENCNPDTPYTGAINIETSETLRFYSVGLRGAKEAIKQEVYVINIDQTSPITSVYPVSGSYNGPVDVSFLRNESGATFYCLASDCTPNNAYVDPVAVSPPAVVRFYSRDDAGNNELVKEAVYSLANEDTDKLQDDGKADISNDNFIESEDTGFLFGSGGGRGSIKAESTLVSSTTASTTDESSDGENNLKKVLETKVRELQLILIKILEGIIESRGR